MLNTNELTELILKAVQAAAAEGGSKAPVVEDGEVPDLSKVDLRKELAVPEPANAEEYLEMNGSYQMTPEQRVDWEAEVRSLYESMVRIVITPTWVKLIDFETTLPSAVEELVQQRAERQQS